MEQGGRRAGARRAAVPVPVLALVLVVVAGVVGGAGGPGPAAAAEQRWAWPLDGARSVVRPFAPGPTRYSPGHYGADLAGSPGRPVRAAGAGRVSYAGRLAGRGVVVVDHGGLRTTYEPLEVAVRAGAQVPRGAVLGRLATGHACGRGTCLHLGLRRGETYLDPLRLFGGPVRLLPAAGPGTGPETGARGAARQRTGLLPPATGGVRGSGTPLAAGAVLGAPSAVGGEAAAARAGQRTTGRTASPAGPAAPAPLFPSGEPQPTAGVLRRATGGPRLERGEWPLAASAVLALLAGLVLVRGSGSRPPGGGAPAGAGAPGVGAAVEEPDTAPLLVPVGALAPPPPAPAPPPAPSTSTADGQHPLPRPAPVVLLEEERRRRRTG